MGTISYIKRIYYITEARALLKYGKCHEEEEDKWNVHVRILLVLIVLSSPPTIAKPWPYFIYISCFLSLHVFLNMLWCWHWLLESTVSRRIFSRSVFWWCAGLPKHPQWGSIHLLLHSIDMVYTKKSTAQAPEVQAYWKCTVSAAQNVIIHSCPTFTHHGSTRTCQLYH